MPIDQAERAEKIHRLLTWAFENLSIMEGGHLYTSCAGCGDGAVPSLDFRSHTADCPAMAWWNEVKEVLGR